MLRRISSAYPEVSITCTLLRLGECPPGHPIMLYFSNPPTGRTIIHFHFLETLFLFSFAFSNRASDFTHAVKGPMHLEVRVFINSKAEHPLKNNHVIIVRALFASST